MKKRAEAGIGTLILFIAMILVAAVAAGVLIQTASSLQSKALATGSSATGQVSTAALINSVYAEDGTNGAVQYFFVEVKLAPGSNGMKLGDTLFEFMLNNASQSLSYGSTVAECNQTQSFTGNYSVEYVSEGSNHRNGYLQQGDVLRVCFRAIREVSEDEEFRLTITPKTGSVTQVVASTPEVMTVQKAYLFP